MVRMGVARVIPVDVRWDFFQQIDQQEDWGRRVQNPQPSDLSIGIQWDGCPLSGPGISVPSPQHPDLHKMHLEDQIRVGRDQFPRWNLPKSHVARP